MTKKSMIQQYVKCIENFNLDDKNISELLHAEYLQWELPNLLNKSGQKSDIADTVRRMGVAKTLMRAQSYNITSLIEEGDKVVMEADWSGELAVDAGPLKKGQILRAFFCMIFEFKNDKIYRIRNYDCFEAF